MVGQLEGEGEKVAQMQASIDKNFDQGGTLKIQVWLKETGSPKSRIDKVVFSNRKEIDQNTFKTFEIRR